MTTEIMLYIIENNQILEIHYLGMGRVLHHFPEGSFSMNAFKRLTDTFLSEIKQGLEVGYADAWITSDILNNYELEREILTEITSHPTANFQIIYE